MWILPHKLRRAALASFAAGLAAVQPLSAQQIAPPLPRYRVNLAPAALSLGGTSAAWLAAQVWRDRLPYATCSPCDATRLLGVDRAILGPVRGGPALASDVTLALAVAGAGTLLASGNGSSDARAGDLAVFAQALSATGALAAWTKVAFHRPRPVRYAVGATAPLDSGDGLSFPSGHASVAFAAAAAYASIQHRHGSGSGRTATALLVSAAATTAVLRVVARRHFPTDVMAGAALGGAVGWIVPAVYPMR
jgi:membrane-associated phospholipid phosphatase